MVVAFDSGSSCPGGSSPGRASGDIVFTLRDYQGKRVNPPYRSSKVIPLKLFLDIVPSSSAYITYGAANRTNRSVWPLERIATPLKWRPTPLKRRPTPLKWRGIPLKWIQTPLKRRPTPLKWRGIPLKWIQTPLKWRPTPLKWRGTSWKWDLHCV